MNFIEKSKEEIKENAFLFFFLCLLCMAFIIGATFNFLAVIKNDCRMPFESGSDYLDKTHVSYEDYTQANLYYFTDILHFGDYVYFSIGDIVIIVCIFVTLLLLIGSIVRDVRKWRNGKRR